VALPASVVAGLAEHLAAGVAADAAALVFTAPDGGPLRYSTSAAASGTRRPGQRGWSGPRRTCCATRRRRCCWMPARASRTCSASSATPDAAVTLNVYSAVIEGRSDDLAERLEGIRQAAARRSGTRGHAAPHGDRPGGGAVALSCVDGGCPRQDSNLRHTV
jgi:hypothetical protein